jgi:hypothetical protein
VAGIQPDEPLEEAARLGLPGAVPDVEVGSDDADHIGTLPRSSSGITIVRIRNGSAYALRTHDPATVPLNGGTGAGTESAIPAGSSFVCTSMGDAYGWGCGFANGDSIAAAAP